MRVIGITGGIGSGKSTVSHILCNLGAKIIDADKIARKILSKGEKALEEIVDNFGNNILDNNGNLDRKKLSDIVFNDSEKLEVLNNITHKYIADDIINQVNREKENKKYETIVLDVPLPVKHGFIDTVDEIWVVSALKETRIKRVMERNGISSEEALKRIESQMSDYDYENIGDEIINNNGDIIDLEKAVIKLYYKPSSSRKEVNR